MLLTSFIRKQLAVFGVIAAVALGLTVFAYSHVPAMLGIGVYDVKADFADATGLYPNANVTYRGVLVGKVTGFGVGTDGAVVTMRIGSSHKIPQDVSVQLHSTSAVGEQYVDLVPSDDHGPFLGDGAVIPASRTAPMPQIGPVLDQLNTLLQSVPRQATSDVLDQINQGLGGAGPDLQQVVDSSSSLLETARAQIQATSSLIGTLEPVLGTQAALGSSTISYANSLAGVTGALASHDVAVRRLIDVTPAALGETSGLIDDVHATLPMLLTNLTTNAQVLDTYRGNLQQILAVYPSLAARLQATVAPRAKYGDVQLDLRAGVNNPPSCSTGYLPTSQRRQPSVSSVRPVDGTAHCAVSSTDPRSVRGDRNLPCPSGGGRAPLPAGCGLSFPGGVWPSGSKGEASARDTTPTDSSAGTPALSGLLAPDTHAPRHARQRAWESLLLGPLAVAP